MSKVMWLVRVQSIHNGISEHRCPSLKSALTILALYFRGKRLKAFQEILKNEGSIDFDNGYLSVMFFPIKADNCTPGLTLAEAEEEAKD